MAERIEPPAAARVDRIVWSALRAAEKILCARIVGWKLARTLQHRTFR